MKRKRKTVIKNSAGEIVTPAASAKPSGHINMNHQTIDWKELKWKTLFSQLKPAI